MSQRVSDSGLAGSPYRNQFMQPFAMQNYDRPFSSGNQYNSNSQPRDPYLMTNGIKQTQLGLFNKSQPKKSVLPPIKSPPKPPPIVQEPFVPIFEKKLKELIESRKPEVVYLNIYNVSGFNKFSEYLGFGFYHTSVEIYKHEFSYGGHDYNCSGIVCVEAGNTAGLTIKEKLPVGITYYSEDEIDDVIRVFG